MAISKKRSLADEIAELTNPAPVQQDVDPELLDFGADALRAMDMDDETKGEDEKHIMRHTPGRLQMRGDLLIDGEKYSGKKTSRKSLLCSGSDKQHSAKEGQESEEGDDDESAEDSGTEEGEGTEEDEEAPTRKKRVRIRQDEEQEEAVPDDASESDDEEEDADMADHGLLQNEELKVLDKEYQQILQQEEEMLQTVKSRSAVDYKKAYAVANQRVLWDKALELCIICQRLLSVGNRLPQPDAWPVICRESNEASAGFKDISKAAIEALDITLDLEKTLLERNEAITAASGGTAPIGKGVKRPHAEGNGEAMGGVEEDGSREEAIWQRIDEHYNLFVPYRNKSVDRWQRKVQLSVGGAAVRSRLRALNQSITTQVASAMRDPSKLINRTRLKRSENKVLGERLEAARRREITSTGDVNNNGGPLANGSGLQEDAIGMGVEEDGDPETFDDSQFFQQLLREFLETAKPGAEGSLSRYALKKLNKQKKVVDRRASKGRKIRYTVMQPLVNFMVPEAVEIPSMAKKLFSTLFGSNSLGKVSA